MMQLIDPDIEAYCEAHSGEESTHLRALRAETYASVQLPDMLSGHVQGRLLSLLSKLTQPKLALEIGTFTGYSALCLAEGLAPGGTLHTIDIFTPVAAMADRYFRKADMHRRIQQHIAPALEVIPRIEGRFDLVFIDADKSNYTNYLDMVIDRMNPGGLIIADNVLWSGKVLDKATDQDSDTKGLAAYARRVNTDDRLESVLLPLRDGLLVSRRK
jgi:predicted O-methyltransferase YrrM